MRMFTLHAYSVSTHRINPMHSTKSQVQLLVTQHQYRKFEQAVHHDEEILEGFFLECEDDKGIYHLVNVELDGFTVVPFLDNSIHRDKWVEVSLVCGMFEEAFWWPERKMAMWPC